MLEEYKKWVSSRKGKFPKKTIKKALNALLTNHPYMYKVWLCGSYFNGDWVDEKTDKKFAKFKKETFGKTISDVDFVTIPLVPSTEEYDIIPEAKNKLLIYDNGKTKI